MDQQEITKNFLLFNKTLFDCSYNAMAIAQDHTEKMGDLFLENSPWMPEQGRAFFMEYSKQLKKNRDGFKKMVDDHFDTSL